MNIFKKTKRRAKSNIGNRCSDYLKGCVVCDMYRYLELFGKFPDSFEDLQMYIDRSTRETRSFNDE